MLLCAIKRSSSYAIYGQYQINGAPLLGDLIWKLNSITNCHFSCVMQDWILCQG